MSEWLPIPENAGKPLKRMIEREASTELDTFPVYKKKYVRGPGGEEKKPPRYYEEAICEFNEGSSLWVFGAGHSVHCNILRDMSSLGRILATDIVEEARKGLDPSIEFRIHDILKDDIEVFDYVFSSHTIEHFTRDQLMEIVLPKCLGRAREAVVFIAPYADKKWSHAPEHRVQLDEHDELAKQATRYKILNGVELVLWFEGKANERRDSEGGQPR